MGIGRFVLTPPARQRGRKTVAPTPSSVPSPRTEVRIPLLTTSVKYARKHITIGSRKSISNGRAKVRTNSRRYEPRRCFASSGERYRGSWFRERMAVTETESVNRAVRVGSKHECTCCLPAQDQRRERLGKRGKHQDQETEGPANGLLPRQGRVSTLHGNAKGKGGPDGLDPVGPSVRNAARSDPATDDRTCHIHVLSVTG